MDKRSDEALTHKFPSHAKALFLLKLGEKLAYDRAFLRLYDAYLKKRWGAARVFAQPLIHGLWEFEDIVQMKRRHLERLKELILCAGGDPDQLVPSQALSTVAQLGIVTVFTDPDSSLKSLAGAVRVVEIAARTSSLYLVQIAYASNYDDFAAELESMHKESDAKIARFAALSHWDIKRKLNRRHLRAIRTPFTSLH